MKCTLCRLLPKEHSFKVCKTNTCDCLCILKYVDRSKNMAEGKIREDSPRWLDIGVKELKGIKLPKVYSDYMYMLWNVSRGIPFAKNHSTAYCRGLKNKNTVKIANQKGLICQNQTITSQ